MLIVVYFKMLASDCVFANRHVYCKRHFYVKLAPELFDASSASHSLMGG
jgi:hypothetical protein